MIRYRRGTTRAVPNRWPKSADLIEVPLDALTHPEGSNRHRAVPLLIALAVLVCFGYLTRCDFTVWDDIATLARNPHLNPPSPANVLHYWREPHMGLYVPVTYTVWSALATFAQNGLPNGVGSNLNPAIFHTANVVLHLLSACVVYALLRRLLRRAAPGPIAIGSLLFALHPVQVEPVAWASGLKDVLCGLLVLTALWQYVARAQMPVETWTADRHKRRARAALATAAFAAATLSKPTALVTPLIAFALDRWFLHRPVRRIVPLLAAWCLLAIPVALVTARVQDTTGMPTVAAWKRPLIAGDALLFYLRHLAWPAALCVDYSRNPFVALASKWTYVAWLVPAAAAAWIWRGRASRPWLMAAAVAFVAPLLPVLGLRPFMMQYASTVADHYLYLPMFGVAVAVATLLSRHGTPRLHAICALLLLALATRSALQTRHWKNDETLHRHTLAVNPNSFTAHINLAHALEVRGDFQGELRECAEAVRCAPDFPMARGNYAVMLATLGHLDEAQVQCDALLQLLARRTPPEREALAPKAAFVARQLLYRHRYAEALPLLQRALVLAPTLTEARADLIKVEARLDEGDFVEE